MTLLSSSYGITIYCAINELGCGKNVVYGLNATEKKYLKGKMLLIGRLSSNNTSKIGIFPSAFKYVSIKFADQCIHILNNKYRLNGLKDSTKMKNRESPFKYQ